LARRNAFNIRKNGAITSEKNMMYASLYAKLIININPAMTKEKVTARYANTYFKIYTLAHFFI